MSDTISAPITLSSISVSAPIAKTVTEVTADYETIGVTKEFIGLGNVDNTSDLNKPISTSVQTALDSKLSEGSLTTDNISDLSSVNKYTTLVDKERLSQTSGHNTGDQDLSSYALKINVEVGGNNLDVQFNDNGAFSGVSAFQYDRVAGSVKIGEDVLILPNAPIAIQREVDGYLQSTIKNTSNSETSSTDIVITANNGTDDSHYLDIGINSSTYGNAEYSITGANSTYVLASDDDLVIGSGGEDAVIKFHVGGTLSDNLIATISESGLTVPVDKNIFVGSTSVLLSDVVIDEDDFISNSDSKVPTQQSTKAYIDAAIFAAGSYTDEQAQDATGALISAGTKTGITVTYDDFNNRIDFDATHNHTGVYAPILGSDDNYITDAEKANLHAPHYDDQIIPDRLSDLSDDSTHRLVTDSEKATWNGKSNLVLGIDSVNAFRGDYGNSAYNHSQSTHAPVTAEQNVNSDWNAVSGDALILNKPVIPTTLSELAGDSTHRTVTDSEKVTWNASGGVSQSMALAYAIAL